MRITYRTIVIVGVFAAVMFVMGSAGTAFAPGLAANSDDFDRERCLEECKSIHIGEWFSNPGDEDWEVHRRGGRGSYEGRVQLYYRCIAACEQKFWHEFDKDTDIE